MKNPFAVVVSWLIANPLASHAVVSTLEALALTLALRLIGHANAPIVAAVIVSAFYYGREAGQREHDLKHQVPPVPAFAAFLGAEFGVKWGLDNLKQWLAAAGATALAAALMVLAGL